MIAFRYRSVDGVYKPLMRLAITWTRIKYRDEKRWRLNLNEQVPVFQVHDRRDRSIIRGSEWIMAVGRRVLPNNPLLIEIAILSIMPCSFVLYRPVASQVDSASRRRVSAQHVLRTAFRNEYNGEESNQDRIRKMKKFQIREEFERMNLWNIFEYII